MDLSGGAALAAAVAVAVALAASASAASAASAAASAASPFVDVHVSRDDVEPERGQGRRDVRGDARPAAPSRVERADDGELGLVRRRRGRRERRRRRRFCCRRRRFRFLLLLLLLALPLLLPPLLEPDPQRQRRGLAHALQQLLGELPVLDAPSAVLLGEEGGAVEAAAAAAAARGRRRGDAAAEEVEVVAAVADASDALGSIKAAVAAVRVRDEEVDVCEPRGVVDGDAGVGLLSFL